MKPRANILLCNPGGPRATKPVLSWWSLE